MKNIVIMGAGGFGTEAVWILEEQNKLMKKSDRWSILGYVDDDADKINQKYYDYNTLGKPEDLSRRFREKELWYFCAIGNNSTRAKVTKRLNEMGWKAATLIHPSVIMARNVFVGEGTIIAAGAILCPNASIGKHVLINIKAVIGHDAILGDYSQACPGAQINGFCEIGHYSFIGSNASILPGKSVGDYAVVGANSQVIRSVRPNTTVNGVPAVAIK